MKINDGIGRKNLIDQIVYFTGKTRQFYQTMSLDELATELKIAKIQAWLIENTYVTNVSNNGIAYRDECFKQSVLNTERKQVDKEEKRYARVVD